ncbi:hypothetical protein [Xanthomonas translucens]|uniref:hypothetical protein n=3 Tax=Xanthomonas campestris pv. translucens TaxID=343 RepID=UPI000AB90421|nr:hypothetical protein [Xanthomonas translucens]MCT8281713.1 hypothetical protein [Xanthomonas translucens pv. undulosa]
MANSTEEMTAASAKKSEDNTALRELSFTSLSAVMSRYLQITDQSRAGSVERWSLIIGLMGAGFGLLSGALLDGKAALVCTVTGLAIELLGFAVSAVLQVIREAPGFRHPYATHAQEMEQQFHHYQGIVTALRAFPLEHRRQRETFIRDRRTNMHERLGLFTGGMERLGVMPVLLALYLQFKDWRWGDWSALGKITAVQSVLAFLLLFSYALSWHLIRLRVRVQTYEQLLVEANRQDSAASG